MFGGETRIYPIHLLVNYWEIQPSRVGSYLDDLVGKGVTQFTSFVPWQIFESDISHSLTRFLEAAAERKMKVSLIITPEVGIHAPFSGLPKDVISKKEAFAQHYQGGEVQVGLPPKIFSLPSLLSNDYTKRYYGFLSKLQGYFNDLSRQSDAILKDVTLVQTGSFWKYYRSPLASSVDMFGGQAGDYSKTSAVSYRWSVDEYYSEKEFSDPSPAAANRWKSASLEEVNQRWFYQQSEETFRTRSAQIMQRRPLSVEFLQVELFTPEADPAMFYSTMLQEMVGGTGDFFKLSNILDSISTHEASLGGMPLSQFVHWCSLGGFKSISDSERQFLLVKSLLLAGGRGGGVFIDHRDWFAFPQGFRSRLEILARSLWQRKLHLESHVLYVTPHLWSSAGPLWEETARQVGVRGLQIASTESLERNIDARLAIIDSRWVLTKERLSRLLRWAHGGRVVALPRSTLYSASAKACLEDILKDLDQPLDINLGIPYRLYSIGGGKIAVYELPEAQSPVHTGAQAHDEVQAAWRGFADSLLSIAQVQGVCKFSDGRLQGIPMSLGVVQGGGSLGLFVMNGTGRNVAADIIFSSQVSVSDLAVAMAGERPHVPADASEGNRFSVEVPPCGVLPLSVEGLETDFVENFEAGRLAEATRKSAERAATGELTGFDPEAPSEAPWN